MTVLPVVVDNRLRFPEGTPPGLTKACKRETSHTNPDYQRMRSLGLWTGNTPSKIDTWKDDAHGFSLPRGATQRVRQVAASMGIRVRWIDQRVSAPVKWGPFLGEPRDYQEEGILQCISFEQGIVRAPTGCLAGDSIIAVICSGVERFMPLADLVELHSKSPSIPICVRSRSGDGRITHSKLLDAYESGLRLTYLVVTDSGLSLRATADHRFLSADGQWKPLSALEAGSTVWVEDHRDIGRTCRAKIELIQSTYLEPTYDLGLEKPHNFLANGIVVHNSGKTVMALALLPRLGQRALVIVRDRNLLEQWVQRAQETLGLSVKDIGVVQGGKRRRIGEHLTIALQQSLYSKKFPIEDFGKQFGAVIVDEVHDTAARTVGETVDAFPARARFGFSADHSRRDRKEFLIEDLFGRVIYSVGKKSLETTGAVVPVVVRLVPTEFTAEWYAAAPPEERDFTRLISEMVDDESRCRLIRQVVQELVQANAVPALVFTHRREHATRLAEVELPADGVPTGLLLGGNAGEEQFRESKTLLLSGVLKVAVGTFKAVGQGIDIPNVMSGVCATPIGANKQFFGQVRGRICRVVPGKKVGHLYYLWDRHVFPEAARNLRAWNDGLVEIFDRERKRWTALR